MERGVSSRRSRRRKPRIGAVTEEYQLRDIGHQCSPDECSQWIDVAAGRHYSCSAPGHRRWVEWARLSRISRHRRSSATTPRWSARTQSRPATSPKRGAYRRKPPEPSRSTFGRLLKGRASFRSSIDRNWRRSGKSVRL